MPIVLQTLRALAEFLLGYAGGTFQSAVQSALTDEVKGKLNEIWGKVKRHFRKKPNPEDEKQVNEVVKILEKLVENGEIRGDEITFLNKVIVSIDKVNIDASKKEENIVKNAEIKNSIVGGNVNIQELKVYKGKEKEEEKEQKFRELEEKQLEYILKNEELNHIPHIFGEGEGLPIKEYYVKLRLVNRPEKRRREKAQEDLQDIVKLPDEIIEECISRKRNRVLVFGEPGSGKTTLSKYLTRCILLEKYVKNNLLEKYMDNNIKNNRKHSNKLTKFRCVFYAKLRDYDGDLGKLVFGEYSDSVESLNPMDYAVVLDGLDEVKPELVRKAVREINDLPFFTVVTTRPTTNVPLAGDQVYEICSLSPEDVRVMSEKWLNYFGLKDVDGFLVWLRERNLMSLASNPLLLYMMCYIYYEGGGGAEIKGRVDVYDEIVELSARHTAEKIKACDVGYEYVIIDDVSRICENVAYEMLSRSVSEIRLPEFVRRYRGVLSETCMGKLHDYLKYCQFVVLNDNSIRFVHETFKEYFAASYLSKEGWKEWLKSVLNEESLPEVKEVVKMLCAILHGNGRDEEVEELLRTIYDSSVDTAVKYPVICECIGEMGLSLCEQGFIEGFDEEYYKELKFGFERGVMAVSDPFFNALVEARDVEFLRGLLKDDKEEVREAAAEALGEIGEPAVEPLIEVLGDEDEWVRDVAAEALGKIGDARAVEPLINALGDDSWLVRLAAAWALGKIGDARAVEPLINALGDEDEGVRDVAAWALGKIGDARAVEPLINALGDDSWLVRLAAAEALKEIGEPAVEPLIERLGDDKEEVRRAAALALDVITSKSGQT